MNSLLKGSIVVSCIASVTGALAQDNKSYKKEIDDWHAKRINGLKADNGWLNLVGLYWLEEGKSSFGSSGNNKVVFPKGTIASSAGYFVRSGNTVKLITDGAAHIKVNNQEVKEAVIFTDSAEAPELASGDLRWTIIQRGDKIGVRLRDLKSAAAKNFNGVPRFPVDPEWKVPAILEVPNDTFNVSITNVLGQTSLQKSPGKLAFTLNGRKYTLDALAEGDELFIIFADSTSGNTTYPSGRFVYAKKPGTDGTTIIDFNKAYNPPCAFTSFATCPLPPKQNTLPIAITAGEKFEAHK